jgi:hypothetical protein
VELNINQLLDILSAKNPNVSVFFFGVWKSWGLAYAQFILNLNKYDNVYALFSILFTGYCHSGCEAMLHIVQKRMVLVHVR